MHRLEKELEQFQDYTSTLSVILSTLIENVNMQMEAETADLIDRRMMSLFAVSHKKLEKADVINTSLEMTKARNGDAIAPYSFKTAKKIGNGIPEVGLSPLKETRFKNRLAKMTTSVDVRKYNKNY